MYFVSERSKRIGIIIALTACVAAVGQTTAPASQPSSLPATSRAAGTQPSLDPVVGEILTKLEQRVVSNLRARLAWRQQYLVDQPEDMLTKRGQIWYRKTEPVAKFLIHFTEQTRGERKDTLDERHLFDGRWYVELQSRTKTLTRREVRRPDDRSDPYRIGQGMFPLPFGQKKEDILREFEVSLAPPTADDPPATDHLHLLPRGGTSTGQTYKELDFWVDRDGATAGLPIKVRVAKLDGTGRLDSHITITFDDARLDEPKFDDGVFELKAPEGYQVTEERLEEIPPP